MAETPKPQRQRHEQYQRHDATPKRPFKIGDALEYRVSRLFIHLGYFVRRGREIYTVGRLDTATDLDVLAIRYVDPLRREVQIAECKGGGDGPLDRVFWLSGVKRYVDANRATLVRPSTKWNIKDFATETGIEILDLPRLEELEQCWGIEPSLWLGASDRDFFSGRADEWNRAFPSSATTTDLYQTLAGEIRFHEPFGGINFLLHHLRALTRDFREQRYASESLTRYLLVESVAQLAMFLLKITEMSVGLSKIDREGLVRKGLTYGHMDKPFIDRIFRNAKQITTEMIRHHTGQDVKLDDAFFRMPEPPHVAGIQDILAQLASRPHLTATLGPIADLLICERFLKQRNGVEWLGKIFPFTDIRERIGLVHDYLKALHDIQAVPDELLDGKKTRPTNSPNEGQAKPMNSNSAAPADQAGTTPGTAREKSSDEGEHKSSVDKEPPLFKASRFE